MSTAVLLDMKRYQKSTHCRARDSFNTSSEKYIIHYKTTCDISKNVCYLNFAPHCMFQTPAGIPVSLCIFRFVLIHHLFTHGYR